MSCFNSDMPKREIIDYQDGTLPFWVMKRHAEKVALAARWNDAYDEKLKADIARYCNRPELAMRSKETSNQHNKDRNKTVFKNIVTLVL